MNTYEFDTLVTITGRFTTADGTPIDPTTVNLIIRDPAGSITTVTGADITRVSEGVYTYDIDLSASGPWIYKWQGTGDVEITSVDTYMDVTQSAVIDA